MFTASGWILKGHQPHLLESDMNMFESKGDIKYMFSLEAFLLIFSTVLITCYLVTHLTAKLWSTQIARCNFYIVYYIIKTSWVIP